MLMTMLDELEHFVLVVRHGTVTAAARAAFRSQPALTASLQRLEAMVGAPVLHRGPRGVRLTAEGEALLPHAEAALASVESGRRAVAEIAGLHAGSVRMGAGPTACTYLLPPIVARYRAAHPAVRFLLREAHIDGIHAGLRAGELDLGLVSRPATGEGFVAEPWVEDPLIGVRAPGTAPLAWVTFPAGSALREDLEGAFPDAEIVMELGSIAAVKGNVRAGVGRALVSRSSVQRDLQHGWLESFDDPRLPVARTLYLVHRGVDQLPPAARRMRELMRAVTGSSPTTPATTPSSHR